MKESPRRAAHTCLLYAQDSKGVGHITRTLTIARHLLGAYPNTVAYIATESPITGEFELPERCDYVKLPLWLNPDGVHATDAEREGAKQRLAKVRAQILRDASLGLAPDLVLVDHEPLGHKGEFREGLWALKAQCPDTKFVFGLRDIMDDGQRIRAQWRELGVYEALESLYDGIAVYGSRELYDVAEAYAIPSSVHSKLHYCGYIVRETGTVDSDAIRRQYRLPSNGPLVVATVGGGSDGFPVLEAAQAAVERLRSEHPDLHAILVTGPLMPADQKRKLRARTSPTCQVVSRADNLQLMMAADAIVSMGGYNSVCEALSVGRPLVIVPRATHKIEQQIRAETLAAHGLARWVHPKDLDGETLAEALEWALHRDPRDQAQLVRQIIPSFEGASRLTAYLARWLGGN
jgi:predicted glycosyltransferase